MKPNLRRLVAVLATLAIAAVMLGAGRASTPATVLEPNKLVILSTTDVKGKNEPCG